MMILVIQKFKNIFDGDMKLVRILFYRYTLKKKIIYLFYVIDYLYDKSIYIDLQ